MNKLYLNVSKVFYFNKYLFTPGKEDTVILNINEQGLGTGTFDDLVIL
jgi:hypothetical protein